MEGLNRAYCLRHWRTVLGGTLCGVLLSCLILVWHWNWHYCVFAPLPGAILSAPYTIKTGVGRLYWTLLFIFFGSFAAAGYFGSHSVLGWSGGLMVPFATGAIACLRWHIPGSASDITFDSRNDN